MIGTKKQLTYPNWTNDGIEKEGYLDYALHSGQIVTILEELPKAFEDADGNACRGYKVEAEDGWTGVVWPGELREPSFQRPI